MNPNDAVARAGLAVHDWIVTVNGQYVHDHSDAMMLVNASIATGAPVQIEYMTKSSVTIDLHTLHLKGPQREHLGVSLRTEPGKKGAVIVELRAEDVLAQQGLRLGDVILRVGGIRVLNHEDAMH